MALRFRITNVSRSSEGTQVAITAQFYDDALPKVTLLQLAETFDLPVTPADVTVRFVTAGQALRSAQTAVTGLQIVGQTFPVP